MADYLPELRKAIQTDRIQKARTLLKDLSSRSEQEQHAVIEMLALASDRTGLELTEFLMAREDLEKTIQDRLFQLATDRAHLNFEFSALLVTHGSPDRVRHIVPLLKHVLTKATSGDLLNLILRAAGKMKLTVLTDDVAEFIFYDDENLKRESVKALERIGTETALRHLEHIAGTDKCDMDILDAIDMLKEKLGQEAAPAEKQPADSLHKLPFEAGGVPEGISPSRQTPEDLDTQLGNLASDKLGNRLAAYTWFSADQELVAQGLHRSLDTDSHDLLLNLLRLTARTIPQQALEDLLTLADRQDMASSLQFTLLTAFAAYPELESAATVLDLATNASLMVRMAAVNVLDHHCSDYIAAEVKNRIEAGTKKGEALGIAILDAGARHLIDALMTSDTFSYIISNYLERSAPLKAIDAYIEVLENRNRASTAKKYRRIRQELAEQKRPFFVVIHPTQAYLDVYTKILHSCGFEARCFSAPQEAFESIVFEKPAGVICDLFIRQISVLELAGEIRDIYPAGQLPIIVSTLQQGLKMDHVKKEFQAKGINTLCEFPAKAAQIKSWGKGK